MPDLHTDMLTLLAVATATGSADEAAQVVERRAQSEAVLASKLPTDNHAREAYEKLGFVFGEVDQADPMWTNVQFPAGWSTKPTDHSMHNDIVDGAGNRRGSYFYKGAFWDRSAITYAPLARYYVRKVYAERTVECPYDSRKIVTYACYDRCGSADDEDVQLHCVTLEVTAPVPVGGHAGDPDTHYAWFDACDVREKEAADACRAWLTEHFDGWEDPGKYWPE